MIPEKDRIKADAPKTEPREQWHVQSLYTLIPKKLCTLLKHKLLFKKITLKEVLSEITNHKSTESQERKTKQSSRKISIVDYLLNIKHFIGY